MCEKLASGVKDIISNIRELELSGGVLEDSLCSVLSVALRQPKLEKLKLVSDMLFLCKVRSKLHILFLAFGKQPIQLSLNFDASLYALLVVVLLVNFAMHVALDQVSGAI